MKGPSVAVLKKYLTAMSKNKVKYMTCASYDLLALIPQIKEYIQEEEDKKAAPVHKVTATRRDVVEYESVSDFVYKKMTFAGMVDRNLVLNEKDLRVLKRLVNDELAELKKKK